MPSRPIQPAQQTAAKVAGITYLVTFAIVVYVNFGIYERLIVEHDATETARNILTHERLFRIGIAGDLIYCAGVIVLLTALYVILKPVSQGRIESRDFPSRCGSSANTSCRSEL